MQRIVPIPPVCLHKTCVSFYLADAKDHVFVSVWIRDEAPGTRLSSAEAAPEQRTLFAINNG